MLVDQNCYTDLEETIIKSIINKTAKIFWIRKQIIKKLIATFMAAVFKYFIT